MIINKVVKFTKNVALLGLGTFGAYKLISDKLFDMTFKKNDQEYKLDAKYLDWLNKSKIEECYIDSYDGLKLYARKIENHKTNNYVIAIHGIWSNSDWMVESAYEFDKLGYNILLIDQRASGKSEGSYYTYGLKESFDLIKWTNYLIECNKNVKIAYYGVSMGAATLMLSTKNKLPNNVKCLVEDCGFSSMKDEIAHFVSRRYKIDAPSVVLNLFETQMNKKLGFNFKDICPSEALKDNDLPLLIIHGEEDHFIPFEMSKIIYNCQKGYKKFYPVKGAKHALAYQDKNYFKNVDTFIKKFVD